MSTATINGDAAFKGSGVGPKPQQQQVKSNASGKSLDGARKQAGSPVDGQNKKQTSQPPKAWQGPNPITQRASNQSSLQNGTEKPLPKLPLQTQQKGTSDAHSNKHAHDRLLYLLAHCTGTDATLTLKSGEQFSGIYSGSSLETPSKSTYVLKMVKRTKLPSSQVNGHTDLPDEYIGEGEDHVMMFDVQDTIDLAVSNVVTASASTTQNGSAGSSFRTDTEISHRNTGMPRQRELQRWDGGLDMSLEDMSLEAPGGSSWDQFAANEQKFGTQTTYDEDEYTTSIDRSHPDYNKRMAEAARVAREIETSTASNAHVAEERRQNADRGDGLDEEEKYSGVRRDAPQLARGGAGSYVPPSRRPITSAPTVPGAPFDPAIISLAKPVPQAAAPTTAVQPSTAQEPIPPVQITPTSNAPVTENSATTSKDASTAQIPTSAQTPSTTKKTENTTEDHVRGTADAFKQFANNEKLRIRQAQEQKRSTARHEKMARLTDLKKFAENFKLKSRVPDDLVPILAKDHDKQLEIKRKAETTAREEELRAKEKEKAIPSPQKQTPAAPATDQRSPLPQQQSRSRPQQVGRAPQSGMVSPPGRIPAQRQNQIPPFAHQRPQQQPHPLNTGIPTTNTSPNEIVSPSSLNRLNVNAKEFKFQPAASNFTPSGASPSPQRTSAGLPQQTTVRFVDMVLKTSTPQGDADSEFDTVKQLREADYPAEQKKGLINGLPQPFRTLPTWPVGKDNENKKYGDAFPKRNVSSQGPSPLPTPNPAGGPMPHAHQLPPHMQGPPNMHSPSQAPRFYGHQQMNGHNVHPPNFDARMQYQGGPNGSVQNSPRYNHAQMAYGGNQMGQMQMPQMPQFNAQPMPGFGMSPGMPYRQMQVPPGGQMIMMQQPQSHMGPMRPNFQHNPSFQQPGMPPMGGHPMAQSHSNSGFMPNGMQQQQPPYGSPMHGGHHMNQQPNGYANSPRPGPQMMQHSGSQQGFQPNMQQMPYGASPSQPPYQQQRHPSGGNFPQMTPRQQQAMPVQGGQHVPSPGMGGHGQNQGDEGLTGVQDQQPDQNTNHVFSTLQGLSSK